jgi:hypothetical protein
MVGTIYKELCFTNKFLLFHLKVLDLGEVNYKADDLETIRHQTLASIRLSLLSKSPKDIDAALIAPAIWTAQSRYEIGVRLHQGIKLPRSTYLSTLVLDYPVPKYETKYQTDIQKFIRLFKNSPL